MFRQCRATQRRRWRSAEPPPPFEPTQVPAIAAGYFWDPTGATGSGASLLVPEGNGKAAFDMVTPAANTAPSAGVINGQIVAHYANGTPDQLMRTAAKVQRGWTGATYFAAWVQANAAPGGIFGHYRTATNLLCQLNGFDARLLGNAGAGAIEQRFAAPTYGDEPFFVEGMFDPTQDAVHRFSMAIDRVSLARTTSNAVGSSIADTAEYLTAGGTLSDGSSFNYNQSFQTGLIYLGNGIPSDADRDLLYSYRKLK